MNPEVRMTLDEAVAEVNGLLYGLDLRHIPEQDRYQAIVRQINRAQRYIALEQEWGYYSSREHVGYTQANEQIIHLRKSVRPRVIGDDSVQLVEPTSGRTIQFAYFLPRDAITKYDGRDGLRVAFVRNALVFSRPFHEYESGLEIYVPVMREPQQFRLPAQSLDLNDPPVMVPDEVRNQLIDFDYPDLVVMKAAYFYAQTDPVMQPRVMQLDQDYKNLMYQLTERDARNTDAPYQNEWNLGIESSISGRSGGSSYGRGIADERGFRGHF